MATKSLFTRDNTIEQNLVESLIIEAIQIFGIDVYYLPKTTSNESGYYGEDLGTTSYEAAYPIEMYVKNIEGFEGDGDFVQQFGLEIRDQITFTVAKSKFEGLSMSKSVPHEGDLIWFPRTNSMYTIQFVEDESIFYQLGELYVYDLQCELFEYENERFSTGISVIDTYGRSIVMGTEIPLSTGSGTFTDGEIIYQGSGLASATMQGYVKSFDSSIPVISIYNYTDMPASGVAIVGNDSGASWTVDLGDAEEVEMDSLDDGDNLQIEQDADNFIDFTEDNPFGDF